MSEYQYYEFLALDRPLAGEQRAELRSVVPARAVRPGRSARLTRRAA